MSWVTMLVVAMSSVEPAAESPSQKKIVSTVGPASVVRPPGTDSTAGLVAHATHPQRTDERHVESRPDPGLRSQTHVRLDQKRIAQQGQERSEVR